ncbi:MAG: DNA polymerase III subunit alpha, partial [Pseudomonadota bacterium]
MTVHLHVHSNFSFGRGASSIEALCAAAAGRGIEAMAITDRNGLYGATEFVQAARDCGIRPVIGAEVDDADGHRAVLLARDRQGYARLCRIITARHIRGSFSLPAELAGGRKGLFVITDHLPMLAFLLSEEGGDRSGMFVEVPPRLEHFAAPLSPSGFTRGRLIRFARKARLGMLAAHPVHFAHPDDWELACVVKSIFDNSSVHKVLRDKNEFSALSWLIDDAMLERGAEDIPGALRAAREVAAQCAYVPESGRVLLPRYSEHDGGGRPCDDSMGMLRERCADGMRMRYGASPPAKNLRRLARELGMIEKTRYADYFLIVSDIAGFARSSGIPMCGRGSAAGALVSYVLGVTDVDPVKLNLSFERFLHEGRKDPPDVDMDFAWNRRDEVIDFVYRRFGRERVAAISTHVNFAARGALREVAKAWGLSEAQASSVSKLLPWHMSAKRIGEAAGSVVRHEPWKTVVRHAAALDGFPKHLGIHVGGMVVTPGPLADYIPAERAPKGIVITQWDMIGVEKAGLLKIDVLGNRSLSVIADALGDIAEAGAAKDLSRGGALLREVDEGGNGTCKGAGGAKRVELRCGDRLDGEERIAGMMAAGNSFGCFYVESPAMRGLLRKLRCRTFEGLVAASSVIRPGVSSSGMMRQYIERARGKTFAYLHPEMEKLLGETFGVMVYQEDVMKVAHHVGGLSWADGDMMRRTMSGKRGGRPLDQYRQRFLEGATARGIGAKTAEEIWRQMESFAGYSFCKAHSAAFAEVSMRALFLRAYWPAEFMAAVLSNFGGYYGSSAYVSECRRMGLEVLRPSVNESEVRFTGSGGGVRVGLVQVAKLSRDAAAGIVEERRRAGRFSSFEELVGRMKGKLGRGELESMIMAGALDEFDPDGNRRKLLWEGARLTAGKPPPRSGASLPRFAMDAPARAKMEIDALGFAVACHPMELVRPQIRKQAPHVMEARLLAGRVGRRVTLAGIEVTTKPIRTSKGQPMALATMEDETALFEVTFFPRLYGKTSRLLAWSSGPYLVTGKVDDDFVNELKTKYKAKINED